MFFQGSTKTSSIRQLPLPKRPARGVKRKDISVVSPFSVSAFSTPPSWSSGSVGDQPGVASTPGRRTSERSAPPASFQTASTFSVERRLPPCEKKRTTGRTRPTHIGGLVAELPKGRRSDLEPAPDRYQGSLPETTRAPPESFHPAAPS